MGLKPRRRRRPALLGTCTEPDRDEPRLVCGQTRPCRWHSYEIDLSREPVTVTAPVTANNPRALRRVTAVARALAATKDIP